MIKVKRAYEAPAPEDGFRVLVDRIWPRGLKKSEARIDCWMKEIAPSSELRKWFNHDPKKWDGFFDRYTREVEKQDGLHFLQEKSREETVTLVFSARDPEHNNAVALKRLLEARHKA